MNWYKIAINEYQTKNGKPITFEVQAFSETIDRRGWIVHKITALVDGKKAGYIKVSYIPRERWNNIYKNNVWKFRYIAMGNFDVPDNLIEKNDDTAIAIDHAKRYHAFIEETEEDILKRGSWWMEREKKRAMREMKLYELYFVDKPVVDFIGTEEEFQRQRVAYNLHMYASEWLGSFGLKLWLSYCRTDQGKCFYDAKLLKLKNYRYRNKMDSGFRQVREFVDV